jgi:hypothetical protein
MNHRKCDIQATDKVAATSPASVKTSQCLQLELTENHNHNARGKVCIQKRAGLMAKGRVLGHHVCHMVSLPKFTHQKHYLKVLQAEFSLLNGISS